MSNAKVAISIPEVQEKIYYRLKAVGWGDKLKAFLLSQDMESLLSRLKEERDVEGKNFTPAFNQVFRAFEECPYNRVKVLFLSQDPYNKLYDKGVTAADGIAFSCANTRKIEKSLMYIHGDIKTTVYKDKPWKPPVDLKVWANQGVLLLNIALTTQVNASGTHFLLWRPFLVYVLDMLAFNNPGLIYVYVGKQAQQYEKITPSNTYKISCTHPAYAAYMKWETWNSDGEIGIWNRINNILEKTNQEQVIW